MRKFIMELHEEVTPLFERDEEKGCFRQLMNQVEIKLELGLKDTSWALGDDWYKGLALACATDIALACIDMLDKKPDLESAEARKTLRSVYEVVLDYTSGDVSTKKAA